MQRLFGFLIFAGIALAILVGAGAAGGYWVRHSLDDRSSFVFKARNKLLGYYYALFSYSSPERLTLETNRLTLDIKTVFLPLEAADYAGGIASTGTATLLIDREGDFFLIDGEQVASLSLTAPENGLDDLRMQFKSGALGEDTTLDPNHFRYNDLLTWVDGSTRHLLLSYSRWYMDKMCYNSVLSALTFDARTAPAEWRAAADDWRIVARTEPCLPPFTTGAAVQALEAGGRLLRTPDGRVLWSSGVYEWDDFHEGPDYSTSFAQSDQSHYGKILDVDLETGEMRALAKGLRNPQGLTIDGSGRIWVTDHGMRGGDELNVLEGEANFGWPAVTLGTHYDGRPAVNAAVHGDHDGYDLPAFAFVPSVAPGSALAVTDFHPAWDGDVLVGAFNGNLFRVEHDNGRGLFAEPIFLGPRLRDMDRLDDGTIVVWTDNRRIIYLRPSEDDMGRQVEGLLAGIMPEALRDEVGATFGKCQTCHGFAKGTSGSGPSLHGLCGRQIASAPGYERYSDALASVGGRWDEELLESFLSDPKGFAPGNSMAWPGLDDPAVASAVAELVCEVSK